jgi:ABC-2 type transport system permease protein
VPVVGIVLGDNAVAGEHESGALRLSLSLPHARRDVVVGTYASRAGLLAATLCVAMAGAGALVVYPFGTLDPLRFLAFVLLTVAFGAVWCGLGLAVSLATATGRRALAGGFGLLFLFVVVWDALGSALRPALDAVGLARGALPEPVRFVLGLEPGRVFARVTAGFVDPTGAVPDAWYLGEWVALALFALWLVAPLGLAARRFGRRDLS